MRARQLDSLLRDLYGCPSARDRWPDVLDQICRETRARSAVIQLLVRDGDRVWSQWMVRDSASEVARVEHDRQMADDVNPRLQRGRQSALPTLQRVFRDKDFFRPGEKALAELKERLAAIRLGHFMSVSAPTSKHEWLALVLHRDVDHRKDFDPGEESFAMRIVPHLQQAVQLARQVEATEARADDLQNVIDQVRCAFVMCAPDARVQWANTAAQNIFSRREHIWVHDNKLTTASARDTAALRRTITKAAQDRQDCANEDQLLVLGRHSGCSSLQLMIRAVSYQEGANGSLSGRRTPQRVLLVLSSPSMPPTLPADLIGRVFALSPAESRLTAALCSGLTLNEHASAAGVTIGTARFQLKQVLSKVNAHRQSDLIRQVCSSVIAQALPRAG